MAAVVVIALAGVWAYSTSFAGVFVFDDGPSIVDNPHIRSLRPLTRAMSAPPDAGVSGRPIAALSLALNYALAPDDARGVMAPAGPASPPDAAERFYRNVWGYHAFNLAVHLCAALLLFGVARRTFVTGSGVVFDARARENDSRPRYKSPDAVALAIALIWVVHPLHTQAVTYVVQRVESLMGLFYLLTLYCATQAAGPPHGGSASPVVSGFSRTRWIAFAVAACAAGMATKEVMVTAPIVVVLWDWTFGVDMRRRVGLYAGLAATWVILAALVVAEHRTRSVGFGFGWTPWTYLLTQTAVVTHYLRLAIVPYPLVFDYGWPPARGLAEVWPQALLLTVLLAATIYAIVKRHPLGFPGGAFFLILAPTSSVLPIATEVAAEHRMYLPAAAVIAAVLLAANRSASLSGERGRARLKGSRYMKGLAVAAVVVMFAETTRARNRVYWNDETLWIDTIARRPANARARIGYGIDLLSAGRFADAERELRVAVALEDNNGRAHMNLGSALCAQGKLAEGIPHLERALALNPDLVEAYGLLGEAYIGTHDHARAKTYLLRGVAALPDNPFLLTRAAWLLATSPDAAVRDGAKAVELAERAVHTPDGDANVVFLDTEAAAYAEIGRFDDAAATARRAAAVARAQGQAQFVPELEQHAALFAARQQLRVR